MSDPAQGIKDFITRMNEKGIPTPIMRDMVTKVPSITYTMMLVSFVLVVVSSFSIGENLGLKFNQCLELLGYVGVGYLGRKYQKRNDEENTGEEDAK